MLRKTRFTIVELLIIISVIMILISLLQPSLNRMMDVADSVKCKTNQNSLYRAVYVYSEDNDGRTTIDEDFSSPWRSYMVSRNQPVHVNPLVSGKLYKYGYIELPSSFYCPTEKAQALKDYMSDGIWGPFKDSQLSNSRVTRIGYMVNVLSYRYIDQSKSIDLGDRFARLDQNVFIVDNTHYFSSRTPGNFPHHNDSMNYVLADGSAATVETSHAFPVYLENSVGNYPPSQNYRNYINWLQAVLE